MRVRNHGIAATALVVLAVAGCSGARRTATSGPQPAAANQSDLAAIAKARADSARYPYTSADIHFMSGMIGHHAQAIKMARWAPTHGASSSVLTLCERIINAQTDEINLMKRWLEVRKQPIPEVKPGPMKMGGMEHVMLMPGMLTPEQMNQLDAARGADFDRLFLTDMIQHHRGAVQMVKELFESPGAGQDELVFKFASDVNVDQTTEIARMQRMLAILTIQGRAP